jgi:hypothetical protein
MAEQIRATVMTHSHAVYLSMAVCAHGAPARDDGEEKLPPRQWITKPN